MILQTEKNEEDFTKCLKSEIIRDELTKGLDNKESSYKFRKNLPNFPKPGRR